MVEEMARQLSMATRRELKEAVGERYRAARKGRERRQILNEFVRVTGYHRKHALRVLNQPQAPPSPRSRGRLYHEAVHQALTVLWETGDRICARISLNSLKCPIIENKSMPIEEGVMELTPVSVLGFSRRAAPFSILRGPTH